MLALVVAVLAYLGSLYIGLRLGQAGAGPAPKPAQITGSSRNSKPETHNSGKLLRNEPAVETRKDSNPSPVISSEAKTSKQESLTMLTLDALRAKASQGDIDAMMALARQLFDSDPSDGGMNEALHWLDQATIMGSTDAALLAGDLCLARCNPADPDDPQDLSNWRRAAQYYFLAYLMGDERALKSVEATTPYGLDNRHIYHALGIARMRLEEVIAARAQRGLGPFQMDLNATSPYLKPDPPTGGEYLIPNSPPGG